MGNIGNIVQNIDPPKNGFSTFDLLTILAGIFAFVPGLTSVGLDAGATIIKATETLAVSTEYGVKATASALTNSLGQTPQVMKALFPINTQTPTEYYQMSSELSSVVGNMSDRLGTALQLVTSDFQNFLGFASTGFFSTNVTNSTYLTDSMYYALNTYIISSCLAQNEVYGVRAVDTSVAQLAANSTADLSYSINCPAYDEYGVCDAWYYSNTTMNTYTLDNFRSPDQNYHDNMEYWFGQDYTTPQALFEGAESCTAQVGAGTAPTIATINSVPSLECVSQLTMWTWEMSCTYENMLTCEFSEGQPQPHFGHHEFLCYTRCESFSGPQIVPYGYLGPLIVGHPRHLVVTNH